MVRQKWRLFDLLIACIGNAFIRPPSWRPEADQKNKGEHKAGGSRKKKEKADPKQPGIFEFTLGGISAAYSWYDRIFYRVFHPYGSSPFNSLCLLGGRGLQVFTGLLDPLLTVHYHSGLAQNEILGTRQLKG